MIWFHIVLKSVVRSGDLFWCLSFLTLAYTFILVPDPPSLTRYVWIRMRYFPSSGLRLNLYKVVPEAILPVVFIWWASHFAKKIIPFLWSLVLNQITSIYLPTFTPPFTTWLPVKDVSHTTYVWLSISSLPNFSPVSAKLNCQSQTETGNVSLLLVDNK